MHRKAGVSPFSRSSEDQRTTSTDTPTRIPIARIGPARLQIQRFASLADELSAAMARVSVDEIDKEIKHWLRKIVLSPQGDRRTFLHSALSDHWVVCPS